MSSKVFALADCNSFYASCEQAFRPDLWGKPVVVLSNNDGCIIARSREAKKLGIKMGEPFFLRKEFFEKNQVYVFSANFTLYGSISARVMSVLGRFAPDMEVYSIDEAFLDFSGVDRLTERSRSIRREVFKHTTIPISLGIGATKTQAKLANYIAKKWKAFKGVYNLLEGGSEFKDICREVPVGELWGVGPRYAQALQSQGVYTVSDFMACDPNWIHKRMTVTGLRCHQELHGVPCIPLEDESGPKKTICCSRSFGQMLGSLTEVEEALSHFVANAARKLRKQGSRAQYIQVFIHTNSFLPQDRQYKNSLSIRCPKPSNSTIVLTKYALFALRKIFREGYRYKKAGVILSDLSPASAEQLSLDFSPEQSKQQKLMDAIDQLQERWGREIIRLGSEGTTQAFQMRQERKSFRYTTRFDEILELRI